MRAIGSLIKSRNPGQSALVRDDPDYGSLAALASTKEERQLLADSKHSALFYFYRCRLVHEFREPGYGVEYRSDGPPYYNWSMMGRGGKSTEELVYPRQWITSLGPPILKNLEAHYRKARIVPHAQYDFGSHWKERRA
jgi:hypothetical protein